MACQAMYVWSLSGLVGAFLDLFIAYFLLCASAMAFMASKFLGFFGLFLPCPCDGFFVIHPDRNLCFQKLFIEYPTEKVSNVQLSVRSKFPFNYSMWGKDQNYSLNLRLIGEKERDVIELEGEASCSSVSDARMSSNLVMIKGELNPRNEVGAIKLLGVREGRFDMKGKGIMHQKSRTGLQRRRKAGLEHGRYSYVPQDPPCQEMQGDPMTPPSIDKGENELVEDEIALVDGDKKYRAKYNEEDEASTFGKSIPSSTEVHEILNDDQFIEKNASSIRELKGNAEAAKDFSNDDKNTIRLLEQALEEELAARYALYLELEKERNAAATAADEAMAMILRLQEEKASIEMEARQYQRIIEEKSAYDAEEMNVLKEIIVWREMEKHFLEKEVEEYNQIINLGDEQPTGNGGDTVGIEPQLFDSSLDPNDDPLLMLHQLSASIDKKVMIENRNSDEVISFHKKKGAVDAWKELPIQGLDGNDAFQKQGHPAGCLPQFSVCNNDAYQELQDKMVPMDRNSYGPPGDMQMVETCTHSCKPGSSQEKFPEKNFGLMGKGKEHRGNMDLFSEMTEKNAETLHIPSHGSSLKQHEKDANQGTTTSSSSFDKEPHVHDVHIIVNQSNLCNQVKRSKDERMPINSTSEIHLENDVSSEASFYWRANAISDCQSTSHSDSEVDIKRSTSDMTARLPPIGPKGKYLFSDLRRNSVSAPANERWKIDNEIGWLRDRLRIVQEGREKLNLSVEHQEREKMQLKLLEDIACQLQEIRQLTEPGKSSRQASLPLPSSKVISKKRRCRSASVGQLTSS